MDVGLFQVLAEGWASPLKGFMREREYLQALHFNCLQDQDNINQSIPIVLAIDQVNKSSDRHQCGVGPLKLFFYDRMKFYYCSDQPTWIT